MDVSAGVPRSTRAGAALSVRPIPADFRLGRPPLSMAFEIRYRDGRVKPRAGATGAILLVPDEWIDKCSHSPDNCSGVHESIARYSLSMQHADSDSNSVDNPVSAE